MSVKTVASYTCAIFSVVVLILCLCTNYWIEYEVIDKTVIGKDRRYRMRAGLWEYCQQVKEVTHDDFGALKCIPVDEQQGTGLSTGRDIQVHQWHHARSFNQRSLTSVSCLSLQFY